MTTTTRDASRIPSLDGLRAVSIVPVLVSHAAGTQGFVSLEAIRPLGRLGAVGVRVFFVISGYLITSLLLAEMRRTGTISLRGFYIRRAFRIFPAAWCYIAVMAALTAAGVVALSPEHMVASALYFVNMLETRGWYLDHLWSLAVEEQFYLLWPAVLRYAGARVGLMVAAAAAVGAPLGRLVFVALASEHVERWERTFPMHVDEMAIGCLLAGARPWLEANDRYMAFLRSPWFYVAPLCAVVAHLAGSDQRVGLALSQPFIATVVALCIHRWTTLPDDLVGRALNLRAVAWVGTLSYSLYLWQQAFLNRGSRAAIHAFPLNVTLALAAATASFYLVEKPLLALRSRLRLG